MSYYGSQHPPPGKKKNKKGSGGFKLPTGSSGAPRPSPSSRPSWTPSGGSTPSSRPAWTPSGGSTPSSSSPSAGSSRARSPFGGFKMPTFGGGGGGSSGGGFGGIWGAEPATPGPTATWSESTRMLVAVGAFALVALAAGLLIFGIVKGGKAKPAGAPAVAVQVTKFVPQTAAQGGKTQLTVTFSFGDGRVRVWEGTGDAHRTAADDQAWASNMVGTVTPSGFLVLTAKPPLKMTPFGAAGGPALLFGDIFTTGVLLTPTSCVPPAGANVVQNASGVPVSIAKTAGEHHEGDLWPKGQKRDFELFGTQQFVKSATDSIEVRNLKPGPSRG